MVQFPLLFLGIGIATGANTTVGPFNVQFDPASQVISFLATSDNDDGFAFSRGGSVAM